MTNLDLIRIGFKLIPHFTITNAHIYNLGRHRQISIGNVGTPNEMMFITETSYQDQRVVTDAICLHNYDYDGYLTEKKIIDLINIITSK